MWYVFKLCVCVCVCECGVHACDLVNVFPWMSVYKDDISMRISLWAMHAIYWHPPCAHLHVPCFLICVCFCVCVCVCVCVASACLCFSDRTHCHRFCRCLAFFPVFTPFSSCWVRCWCALRGEMGGEGGCREGHSHVRHVRGRRRRCQCKSVSQSSVSQSVSQSGAAVGRGSLSAAVPESCISAGTQTSCFWLLSNQDFCSAAARRKLKQASLFSLKYEREKFCRNFLGQRQPRGHLVSLF